MTGDGEPLVCPECAQAHAGHERFCHRCGLPLVIADAPAGDVAVSPQQALTRKIKPQYAEGDLVKVGWAQNQPEAEFMQGLLLEEGVPSVLRRARGFDVPEMLAAGPRDILVPRSGHAAGREVLLQAELAPGALEEAEVPPLRVFAGLMAGIGVVAVIVLVVSLLV